MPNLTNDNLAETKKIDVKYYYPELMSYRSLKKSLKSGIAKKEISVIKKFQCDCAEHKYLQIKALVAKEENKITIENCQWLAKTKGRVAINSEGEILDRYYKFYSKHPDWKVRVAVAVGLGKVKDKRIINLLLKVINDQHYGVSLAASQALETVVSEHELSLLKNLDAQVNKKRVKGLINRVIERIKFGFNRHLLIKHTLDKLQRSKLIRRIHHKKEKKNKILIPRQIFHSFFNKNFLKQYFNHWNGLRHDRKGPTSIVKLNKQRILIQRNRTSAKKSKQSKFNYVKSLFFGNILSINKINMTCNPVSGEIYWAIADTTDPKVTRPVLIVKPANDTTGDFLVVPLTSDILSPPNGQDSLIVQIKDIKSRIQISRQRVIHQSLLLNKYGDVPASILKKVQDRINSRKPNNAKTQYPIFYRPRNNVRPKKSHDREYSIGDLPIASIPTPNVSIMTRKFSKTFKEKKSRTHHEKKSTHIITLGDFFPSSFLFKNPPVILNSTRQSPYEPISQATIKINPDNNNNRVSQKVSSKKVNKIANPISEIRPSPPSPRTQRMFSSLGKAHSVDKFKQVAIAAPDLNRRNAGKLGDTALMMLLREKKLGANNELPKIKILVKHGALWTAKNNHGESANDLAKKHDPQIISTLKK